MRTGISIYFGTGIRRNEEIVERAAEAGVSLAFTSMHIPEESGVDYAREARWLMGKLRDAGIGLIVDVGPRTYEKLGCERIEDLRELGITHIRLDYGFSASQTAELSRTFRIVCNASTVTREEVHAWRAAGADLTKFSACHNYYPKRLSGLSLDAVRRMNDRLMAFGFETMGFVPGDGELRGPLYEGLPTVEAHRDHAGSLALNVLELAMDAGCDSVLVGDIDLSDSSWEVLRCLSQGYIDTPCTFEPRYEYLRGQIHHDRPDSSALVFRSQESRTTLIPVHSVPVDEGTGEKRPVGTIAVSNSDYGRYEGELEISRVDLPGDRRMNVAGTLDEEARKLLPYVRQGFGLRFV